MKNLILVTWSIVLMSVGRTTGCQGMPGVPSLPFPSLLTVTASSFKLLSDKIGYELSLTYSCGVTVKLQSYINETIPIIPIPLVPSVPLPFSLNFRYSRTVVTDVVSKILNPIVLIGSTCLPGICASYNVNQNTMTVD